MLEKILKTKGVDNRVNSRKHLGILDTNTSSKNNQKLKYMQS